MAEGILVGLNLLLITLLVRKNIKAEKARLAANVDREAAKKWLSAAEVTYKQAEARLLEIENHTRQINMDRIALEASIVKVREKAVEAGVDLEESVCISYTLH